MNNENVKFHVGTIMKAIDLDNTMPSASKSTLKAAVKLFGGFLENSVRQTKLMEHILEELQRQAKS